LSILDQADNPRRLVQRYDDSDVSSYAYSYSTPLGGIPRRIRSYRLSFPLHDFEDQSRPWGMRITLASRGQEFHLHREQVIKDYIFFLSLIPDPKIVSRERIALNCR